MSLDLRLPIGLLFTLLGVLLLIYGFASDPAMYHASLGVNVNAWWGLVMLVFGALMLGLAWRAQQQGGSQAPPSSRV